MRGRRLWVVAIVMIVTILMIVAIGRGILVVVEHQF